MHESQQQPTLQAPLSHQYQDDSALVLWLWQTLSLGLRNPLSRMSKNPLQMMG